MLRSASTFSRRLLGAKYSTKATKQDTENWYKDGLKFACTGCGKCCTGASGHVWLTETDIIDISKRLKLDSHAFLKKYARWIPRMGKWSLIEKMVGEDFHCIFLENGKLCSVYDLRPVQCRTFPYWPEVMESRETWNTEKLECEGIDNPEAEITSEENIITTLITQLKDKKKTLEVGRHPTFENAHSSNAESLTSQLEQIVNKSEGKL